MIRWFGGGSYSIYSIYPLKMNEEKIKFREERREKNTPKPKTKRKRKRQDKPRRNFWT